MSSLNFYDTYYELLCSNINEKGMVFGDDLYPKECRFCGYKEPNVTFNMRAHAFPESIGNKSIFTNYECDRCNQFFGYGIENDLATFIRPILLLSSDDERESRPQVYDRGISCDMLKRDEKLDPPIEDAKKYISYNLKNKKGRVRFPRSKYDKVAVQKAFIKMALSVVPEDEISNYKNMLEWIRVQRHKTFWADESIGIWKCHMKKKYPLTYALTKNNEEISSFPIMIFHLLIANYYFAVEIPHDDIIEPYKGDLPALFNISCE